MIFASVPATYISESERLARFHPRHSARVPLRLQWIGLRLRCADYALRKRKFYIEVLRKDAFAAH